MNRGLCSWEKLNVDATTLLLVMIKIGIRRMYAKREICTILIQCN